jgi:hypothetical protein
LELTGEHRSQVRTGGDLSPAKTVVVRIRMAMMVMK